MTIPRYSPPQARRGSLVTPLLLIGVGALFLARNVFPDLPLLDYLAQYWPLLLILWGSLRLLEIVAWAATSKPLPVRGITGGEWTLVIFLCLAGFSLHAARGFYTWLPASGIEWGGLEVFGQVYEYPLSGEVQTGSAPRVTIESFRGNARISGGDVTAVTVSGHHTIRSMNQADADRANQELGFEVTGDENRVVIRPLQGRRTESQRISADLNITVPRGASITATGRGGDFDINSIDGEVEIDGANASVRLEEIAGNVRLELRNSDIIRAVNVAGEFELNGSGDDVDLERIGGQVTVDGSYGGVVQMRDLAMPVNWDGLQTDFSARAIPGQLRLTLSDLYASGITGPFRVTSQSKDMWLTQFSDSLDLSLNRGDVLLVPGAGATPRMNVRLNAGNVELALPEGGDFNVTARTERGRATNSFGAPLRVESFGRGATVLGLAGAGGTSVDVAVDRGQILVRRAGVNETNPPAGEAGGETVLPEAPLEGVEIPPVVEQ